MQKTQNAISDDLHTLGKAMRDALKPFADRVYNDNGDIAVTDTFRVTSEAFIQAYFAYHAAEAAFDKALSDPPAALAWHELATADPLTRAAAWDRCYPGNVNIERLVDDLAAELKDAHARLSEPPAALAGEYDGLVAWCHSAARYFEDRPTNGEDAAHWANVANAETARKLAAAITTLQARLAERKEPPAALAGEHDHVIKTLKYAARPKGVVQIHASWLCDAATALESLSARVVAAGQEIIRLSVIAGEALRDQKAAESRVAELEAALRLAGERFDQLSDAPDPWTRESCEKWSAQIDAALSTEAKAQGGER